MKRTLLIVGLFASSLLRQGWTPVFAQDANVGGQNQSSAQSLKWQVIAGVGVLRVWQVEGADKYPQVALLRVTTDDFHKFTHSPPDLRKFVNDNKVFSKSVIEVGPCVALSSVDETGDSAGWVITVLHTLHSRMTVSALPANPDLKPYFQPEK